MRISLELEFMEIVMESHYNEFRVILKGFNLDG